ncbi:MAG TPA: glycerophosphodiester phosphodiesterase family protein, partial [Polyangiaceae bacterium]|nr:glycerophosphodiester phosphodiesterase family protein [Polyangiaceae bacterium]
HDRVIHALRALVPALRTAATASEAKRTLVLERCRLGRWAPRGRPLFVPEWYRGLRVLSPRFVRGARSAGDNVWVWVVDDAKRARALIELGVDGCFTTRPQGLCRELSLLASAGTDGNRVEL